MTMLNSQHYFLKTDKQLLSALGEALQKRNINNFSDLVTSLDRKQLNSFTEIWNYSQGSKCPDDLALCLESLVKRIKVINNGKLECFRSSSQAGWYLTNKLCGQMQEQLYAIYLDSKNKIIAEKLIFQGTLNRAVVHPRDIFRWAIIYNCAGFFIVHNHPSGDHTPSQKDLEITRKIKAASEFMGIDFLDHFIVSDNNYTSFKEEELL